VPVMVTNQDLSVQDAVRSYLFNSQLLSHDDGYMTLVVPHECREVPSVSNYLDALVTMNTPIKQVKVFDLKQSMQNGGGPACLRLRVALNEREISAVHQKALMNEAVYSDLVSWVEKHYRDRISPEDLADPLLLVESRTALDELTQLLDLGSIYPFQRG